MSLSRFRLITFDVANTLLKYRYSPAKHYGEIGALFGVMCDTKELAANFISKWHKMHDDHPNFGRYSKNMSWKGWWHKVIDDTFKASGVKLAGDHLEKLSDQFIEIYKTSTFWQYCYGSIELLNYLKTQRELTENPSEIPPFKLGIIANFDPRLEELLKNMKIDHYFDFILNSYDCKHEKPKKEIFEIALRKASIPNLSPSDCLHVGDGPITDCVGAHNAGWHSALIREESQKHLIKKFGKKLEKCHVFSSLFDFQQRITNSKIDWK